MPNQPYRERQSAETARYCLYCGSHRSALDQPCATCGAAPFVEGPTPSLSEPLDCPRCHTRLTGESLDGAVVFRCSACLGCFVPERAWSMIMDRVCANAPAPMPGMVPLPPGRELAASTLFETVKCPLCGRATDRITFGARSGVVVDVCGSDGTWFDAAELVRVKQFVRAREENGGVVPVSEEELEQDRRVAERLLNSRVSAAQAALERRGSGYRQSPIIPFLAALLRE